MHFRSTLIAGLLGCAFALSPAHAAINASKLGASYDATKANVSFKIYSSRATRIELYLYSSATGTAEKAKYVMTLGAGGVWSVSIPTATLSSQGLTGTLYYGYRAWGPNWPYNAAWTKGSATGFISDVDASGNRFNPNKLLLDPYALEMSHDPTTPTMSNGTIYASGATLPQYRQRQRWRPRASCWPATRSRSAPSRPARSRTTSSTKSMCAA